MPKKLTQAEFLAKAVAVHGVGRYDYSQAVYAGADSNVSIGCREHGVFEQKSITHTRGSGCPKCGDARAARANTHSAFAFVAVAQAVHGNRYDYSQVEYMHNSSDIKIICPEHGVFNQAPINHTQGAGCPDCAITKKNQAQRYTTLEFIAAAQAKHGTCYDYSQVNYLGNVHKVEIICPAHGVFSQLAQVHIAGGGCPVCRYMRAARARASTASAFITAAQSVHGVGTYDYSQVTYVNSKAKVTIICPTHGAFEQDPNSHQSGRGCIYCAQQRIGQSRHLPWIQQSSGCVCTLYFVRIFNQHESFYKVGVTRQSVKARFKSQANISSYSYEILARHTSIDAIRIFEWEQSIIESFAHLRYRPKQSFPGSTECFSSADEILNIFPL